MNKKSIYVYIYIERPRHLGVKDNALLGLHGTTIQPPFNSSFLFKPDSPLCTLCVTTITFWITILLFVNCVSHLPGESARLASLFYVKSIDTRCLLSFIFYPFFFHFISVLSQREYSNLNFSFFFSSFLDFNFPKRYALEKLVHAIHHDETRNSN